MRKTLLLTLAMLVGFTIFAQQQINPCYTDEHQEDILQAHPEWRDDFEQARDALLQEADQRLSDGFKKSGAVYTIPVVFHVIYNTPYDNISRAQIVDAIRVLNEDYRRQNADASATRPMFKSRSTDIEVEFALAKVAPDGSCTDGITRRQSGLSVAADPRDQVKSLVQWDPNKYLNIWVVNSIKASSGSGITLGYANFPWMPASKDGIVVRHDALGQIGTSVYGGRTLTHEVGHYLGLLHTFQGGCTQGDGVGDTPPVSSASFGCNLNRNSCHSDKPDLPDMIENYMDYADGLCQNAFTLGQKSVMRTTLQTKTRRKELWTPANLLATGVDNPPCKPQAAFATNHNSYTCSGSSITFIDESENGAPDTYSWSFPGGNPSTSTLREPTVVYDYAGTYDVSLTVTNSAGSSSVTYDKYVDVKAYYSGNMAQWSESFEDGGLSSSSLSTFSSSDTIGFQVSDKAAQQGGHSLVLGNFGVNNQNEIDEFISPNIFTQFGENMFLNFSYAFAAQQSMNTDELRILVSSDCGETWNLLKMLTAGGLRSVALPMSSEFIPSGTSEWKSLGLPLIAYKNKGPILIKFQFINGGGNNFYLDNINVTSDNIGLDEQAAAAAFSIYPNPGNGQFTLQLGDKLEQNRTLRLRNLSGQTVKLVQLEKGAAEYRFESTGLPAGVYLLDLESGKPKFTQKLVIR